MGAQATEGKWPHCAAIGGTCLAYDMGAHLGPAVQRAVLAFIFSAEEGARLTLQKNSGGFTVQVTGAVLRAEGKALRLEEARPCGTAWTS